MPICITCSTPVKHLYTTYSKADDRSLGKGVRLTQCPNCKRFADKYVEHDYVVLFIDLVLIKPQVYRHLLFNRLGRTDNKLNPSILRLGILLILFDVYITWARIERSNDPGGLSAGLSSTTNSIDGGGKPLSNFSKAPIITQYLFFLTLNVAATLAQHITVRVLVRKFVKRFAGGRYWTGDDVPVAAGSQESFPAANGEASRPSSSSKGSPVKVLQQQPQQQQQQQRQQHLNSPTSLAGQSTDTVTAAQEESTTARAKTTATTNSTHPSARPSVVQRTDSSSNAASLQNNTNTTNTTTTTTTTANNPRTTLSPISPTSPISSTTRESPPLSVQFSNSNSNPNLNPNSNTSTNSYTYAHSYASPSAISTALLVSSCTKLFPILLVIWPTTPTDHSLNPTSPTSLFNPDQSPSSTTPVLTSTATITSFAHRASSYIGWIVLLNNAEALQILLGCGYWFSGAVAVAGVVSRWAVEGWLLGAVGLVRDGGGFGDGPVADVLGLWAWWVGSGVATATIGTGR